MTPIPWSHLLAGPIIALCRKEGAIEATDLPQPADLATDLLQPRWRVWFGGDTTFSRTDLEKALGIFYEDHKDLVGWYRALLKPPAICIEWNNRQPYLAPASVARWELMANFLDPDALLAFDLAYKRLAANVGPDLEGLERWQTLPQISDHELRQMFSMGLSDLHIHSGGVRIAQAVWCDLMEGQQAWTAYPHLIAAYREDRKRFSDGISETEYPGELEAAIALARSTWDKLALAITGISIPRISTSGQTDEYWTWSVGRLRQERYVLIHAWKLVVEKDRKSRDVLGALDHYLHQKHRFFRLTRQPVHEGVPGLRHFDRQYFPRLKRRETKPLLARLSYVSRPSPRRIMSDTGNVCMYLLESPNLTRVELRVAPKSDHVAYIREFSNWKQVENRIRARLCVRGRKIDIRFAVHFKRSHRSSAPGHGIPTRPETVRILEELDADSAMLRRAMSEAAESQKYSHAMTSLARIDVAGQERDTQLGLFVMHMRLLRGDPEMLKLLDSDAEAHPCVRWLARWKYEDEQGRARPRLSQPRLGMTVHAGEDFADILDGLHQMGVAVDHFGLGPGDSIGHGLALKSVGKSLSIRHLMVISMGAHHDSLCWLYDFLENEPSDQNSRSVLAGLRGMITRSGYDIFSEFKAKLPAAHAEDFVWAWKHKMLPLYDEFRRASPTRQEIVRLEYTTESDDRDIVVRAREAPASEGFTNDRLHLAEVIPVVQALLLSKIKTRRILIEMNPASNLRIAAAGNLGASPTVGIAREIRDGLLASVNTDNPGVFGSRIENEYALLLGGLLESGETEAAARALLESARHAGNSLLHWPNHATDDLTDSHSD